MSNYLKEITGRWLGDQAAVLTEIAFEEIGDVVSERVKWLRRKVKRTSAVGKPHLLNLQQSVNSNGVCTEPPILGSSAHRPTRQHVGYFVQALQFGGA